MPPPVSEPRPLREESAQTSRPEPFYSEPPTKQKNVTASVYQSLLSVFDDMSAEQRMEFVEFAARYSALETSVRRDLIELLPLYDALAKPEREALHERATELAVTRHLRRDR